MPKRTHPFSYTDNKSGELSVVMRCCLSPDTIDTLQNKTESHKQQPEGKI